MTHVITGLDVGGAEMALSRLVAAMDAAAFPSFVVSLKSGGEMAERLRDRGVEVIDLALSLGTAWASVARLADILRRREVDVVQCWLHHADLIGGIAARRAGVRGVAWGVRSSSLDPADTRLSTRAVMRACAMMSSRVPDVIVANSRAGATLHAQAGYDESKFIVIPNGFDVVAAPDRGEARADLGRELGLSPDERLVGSFGRFDPQKDFRTLCDAIGRLARTRRGVTFVLAGRGVDTNNSELGSWIRAAGIETRVRLLGLRHDMPRLLAAMDLVTTSSAWGEAFPQVVGEAMSVGTPCVATDVGDSAQVVADTGIIVPSQDADALATGWERLLALPPGELRALGERARGRIEREYSLESVAHRYAELYRSLA